MRDPNNKPLNVGSPLKGDKASEIQIPPKIERCRVSGLVQHLGLRRTYERVRGLNIQPHLNICTLTLGSSQAYTLNPRPYLEVQGQLLVGLCPLIWVISIVTLLITPLITTHEPPSKLNRIPQRLMTLLSNNNAASFWKHSAGPDTTKNLKQQLGGHRLRASGVWDRLGFRFRA